MHLEESLVICIFADFSLVAVQLDFIVTLRVVIGGFADELS